MSNEKMRDELTAMANDLRHNEDVDYVDIADRLDELALSAQASAEPVAYRVTVEFMGNTRHYLTDSVVVAEAIEEHRQGVLQPLYTHPPRAASPVVPEAIEPDDAPEMIPDDEEDMKNAYADGWNACRQALLATSTPSEPKRVELTDAKASATAVPDGFHVGVDGSAVYVGWDKNQHKRHFTRDRDPITFEFLRALLAAHDKANGRGGV